MNQHQVLTGAVNPGDYCYSVGSVEGVPFTVYAAGCNIVILSSELERVQIIAGVCHGNVQVTSLDCSNDVGKIGAAYGKKISIFEPSPLLNQNSSHKLDYRWVETASIEVGCHIKVISWNISATRLLVATENNLELWNYLPKEDSAAAGVKFTMGADEEEEQTSPWLKSWSTKTSAPVHFLKFANDGTMFASAARNDRLAKIWYETCDSNGEKKPQQKLFSFVYLPHPRAVTALSWRHTSKYMPRGCVANMLVTSCKDNICRLWSQTLLPEDGLINLNQIEALANQQPRLHRHKNKIMNKLKHIKSLSEHKGKSSFGPSVPLASDVNGVPLEPLPSLPSSYSINDFHNFALQGSGVAPGIHFHLAASINAESDIPLVPAMRSDEDRADDAGGHFVLHWLNNKEICFSRGAEKLLHDVSVKAFQEALEKQKEAEQAEEPSKISDGQLPDDASLSEKSPTTASGNKSDARISHSNSSISNGSATGQAAHKEAPKEPDHRLGEALESKLEALLKQWHRSSDLLFSVHPIDGSFLVWIVEYLDESIPGAFRQPQVSFTSRLSNAIALGDAATMSQNISLYLPTAGLDLKTVLKGLGALESTGDATKDLILQAKEWTCTPTVSMISKHSNGSLNLWYLTFSDEEQLTQVLSVTHSNKRVCGHRFRINDITCHPALPLLLTTSHHNSPQTVLSPTSEQLNKNGGFCSELILWKVESVGPLSKSGGIAELARINSSHLSAFSNVAWIPTLLPSTTLGTISNSPSACFVASDGTRLRVYQALIDARSLLAELTMARKRQQADTLSVSSAATSVSFHDGPHKIGHSLMDGFNIVSLQSTARPGCIIELDAINDAVADWQHTQLLHVFQESLILGNCEESKLSFLGEGEKAKRAYVDLKHTAMFCEPFYLVVIEKNDSRSILHMWKLTIASQEDEFPSNAPEFIDGSQSATDQADPPHPGSNPFSNVNDAKDSRRSSRSSTPDHSEHSVHASPLKIVTEKLCEQVLPLPDNVEIVHAEPSAGHLSSTNIYPACLAPYLISTACSDGRTRFWRCTQDENGLFCWEEWRMVLNSTESAIEVDGRPLAVSAAYSGRVAVAFKVGSSFTRPTKGNEDDRYVNLAVSIYECESTGGSEWMLEDTIRFRNVKLPKVYCGNGAADDVDLCSMYDANLRNRVQMDHIVKKLTNSSSKSDLSRMLSVPSYATLQTLKKSIIEQGNQCVLTQKSLMQLDWVSSEDGSHILTVALGPKVMLYAPVSYDIAQCNAAPTSTNASSGSTFHRPLLKQRSSMAPQIETSRLRWMQIRGFELRTADGLPALPMQLSWVRDGILVVGMDNEMHVYSQWKPHKRALTEDNVIHKNTEETFSDPIYTKRCLQEDDLLSRVQETQLRLGSSANLTRNASSQLMNSAMAAASAAKGDKTSLNSEASFKELLPDFGLFETSRLACPMLPQYHPKQLMELLAFGKIKRVKAILAHLVRCLQRGAEQQERQTLSQDGWSKSRTYSLAAPSGSTPQASPGATDNVFTEEIHLDYVEITSIPPLPLHKLLDADTQVSTHDKNNADKNSVPKSAGDAAVAGTASATSQTNSVGQANDYSILFEETHTFNALNEDSTTRPRTQSSSERRRNPNHFGTQQANILTQVLTHCSLPGLSSLDQVHLLALADSVASFQSSITERFSQQATVSTTKHDSHHSYVNVEAATEALDDSGLRYLLATRHHTYLLRCLPLSERASLQKQGLPPHSVVWAFHSETQEELVQLVLNQNNLKWADLKDLGVGWWCKNNASLKKLIERVAKNAFQKHQNPLDASFYYMALKKKNILTGLFRSVSDRKMTDFFQNNFNEDRWRRAALKNAYALLGKQKFKHAAAFFLLANDLKSAVQVCLNNLDDLQLAMVLIRLYDGGEVETYPDSLRPIVYSNVLGCNEKGEDAHASQAHPDPFIRSMAYWILKHYEDALATLLQTDIGCSHPAYKEPAEGKDSSADPAVFNFYLYLRTHPFVVRRNLARLMKDRRQSRAIMLSGFNSVANGDASTDTITPLERRLFFTTAHAHFRAGCPPLALEVLSRLPNCQLDTELFTSTDDTQDVVDDGALKGESVDWSLPVSQKASDFDWGPAPTAEKASDFDWSQPEPQRADAFDWSQPFSSSQNTVNGNHKELTLETSVPPKVEPEPDAPPSGKRTKELIDVMAQQLKFIACLKIMMEELSTLATGLEVDGGQLRFQLYVWLEKCVAALRQLCHYGANEATDQLVGQMAATRQSQETVMLHDVLLQDKKDFEDKIARAARRKQWLKINETLLRTLLSYSALHGAHGGGLAAVRMELNLLLQELQQVRTPQALLASPLPIPTSLPLLAASVASNKTVVADPVRHVQSLAHDILQTITQDLSLQLPQKGDLTKIMVLRDLSLSLSACIYQALCDSDNIPQRRVGLRIGDDDALGPQAVLQNSLYTPNSRERLSSASTNDLLPTSAPSKWPGVQSLRALMARDKDEDAPKLHTLLCEAFVAVYMSLTVHAMASKDSQVLFRLVAQRMSDEMWAALFGGGAQKLLKVQVSQTPLGGARPAPAAATMSDTNQDQAGIFDSFARQRFKFNVKILPGLVGEKVPTSPPPADKTSDARPTYKEVFVPPSQSMVSRMLTKPHFEENCPNTGYDSTENVEDTELEEEWKDDVFDEKSGDAKSLGGKAARPAPGESVEEIYAWNIIGLSVLTLSLRNVTKFLQTAGIEFGDLPVASPLIHASLKALQHWLNQQKNALEKGPKVTDLLPNMTVDSFVQSGPAIHKYKVVLEGNNTPFRGNSAAVRATKRLWFYLAAQEECQEIYIKYIFSPPKRPPLMPADTDADLEEEVIRPIRVIHKDQESISAFCIDRINGLTATVATPKDMQELDISRLLLDVGWLENEAEFDILNRNQDTSGGCGEYLVIEHPIDRQLLGAAANTVSSHGNTPIAPLPANSIVTSVHPHGKSNVNLKNLHFPGSQHPQFCEFVLSRSRLMVRTLKKHKVDSVRRLASHPSERLYLSGGQDGAVQLWEWGHASPVCTLRLPGTHAKVTSCCFNSQGNKLGVTDGDGFISLWQASAARTDQMPFFTTQCHSKQASEFAFAGSSSLLATGGQSSDGKNVCLWDTLLPQRKAMIGSFQCHEHGCSALLYAPHNRLLISAGKKGDIAIIDVRQRVLHHKFQAHDSAVKCLSLDPHEEFFISGSADGDIKVWSLPAYGLQHSFKGEHSKNSLFRSMASGVTNLYVDDHSRIFSCGADGSLKLRQLPKKESVVELAPF